MDKLGAAVVVMRGVILLTVWRAPTLVAVAVGALGGIGLAYIS